MKRFRLLPIIAALLAVAMVVAPAFAARDMFGGGRVPGGIYLYTDQTQTTGDVFWVDDSGTDAAGYGKNPDSPVATIDYAIGLCTAGQGDTIYVMPGHAETVATAITVDVQGVRIIGLGHGRAGTPTITGNGTIDAMTITAADVLVENLIFAAPSTDAQTADINIAAARVTVKDTVHHGSTTAKNKVAIITVTAAGHDFVLDGVTIYNDTVECPYGILLEGAAKRGVIRGVNVYDSIGFTYGSLTDAATALGLLVERCVFSNAKADTVCVAFSNNTTGITRDTFVNGRHTTITSNLDEGTGMAFYETYVVEEAAKNGLLEPVVDAN